MGAGVVAAAAAAGAGGGGKGAAARRSTSCSYLMPAMVCSYLMLSWMLVFRLELCLFFGHLNYTQGITGYMRK